MTISDIPRFRSVMEFSRLIDGYDYCRANGPTPFVVRNCVDFIEATQAQVQSQIKFEKSLHGYNSSGRHHVTGRVAFDSWLDGTLSFNIVDSNSSRGSRLLPSILRELNIANHVDSEVWFSYVLTVANVQSKVHVDPPFGSGWQFLTQGSKEWTIIDEDFFDSNVAIQEMITPIPVLVELDMVGEELSLATLVNVELFRITATSRFSVLELIPAKAILPVRTNVMPLSITSLSTAIKPTVLLPIATVDEIANPSIHASVEEDSSSSSIGCTRKEATTEKIRKKFPSRYLSSTDHNTEILASEYPNELYRVIINANDFLSCPANWPHSVDTIEKSCGLSGYMKYDIPSKVIVK
jgi:hypothetical protein